MFSVIVIIHVLLIICAVNPVLGMAARGTVASSHIMSVVLVVVVYQMIMLAVMMALVLT
jgi:hypothetical protein